MAYKLNERHRPLVLALAAALLFILVAPKLVAAEEKENRSCMTQAERSLGLKLLSLRPTAGGYMLDLRMKVVNASRAAMPLSRNHKAYLTETSTGKTVPVPMTKGGPMRQTTLKPKEGVIYFALFKNPAGMIKPGQTVDLTIGDMKVHNIRVLAPDQLAPPRPQVNESDQNGWERLPESRQTNLINTFQACVQQCEDEQKCLKACQSRFDSQLSQACQMLSYLRILFFSTLAQPNG
jgi:hypothetical protein